MVGWGTKRGFTRMNSNHFLNLTAHPWKLVLLFEGQKSFNRSHENSPTLICLNRIFYQLYRGIHHHLSPPFGSIWNNMFGTCSRHRGHAIQSIRSSGGFCYPIFSFHNLFLIQRNLWNLLQLGLTSSSTTAGTLMELESMFVTANCLLVPL